MAVELSTDQIKDLLQGISIPPQPQIMVDLQLEQYQPDCSIDRITTLISQDVGLAGSILKTVNSSFFGLSNKITSINQAIGLLSSDSVINIVNALSIRSELSDDAIVGLSRFWDSTMDIAMACAAIAKQIDFGVPDEAYTLGLFHNCGIPLLMQRHDGYSELMEQTYSEQQGRIIDKENEILKTNHAVVGYYVSRSWNLPDYICQAIAEHHSADKIFAQEDTNDHQKKTLIAILKMAEHICGNFRSLGNQEEDYEWLRLADKLLDYAKLSDYDFQNLMESIHEMGIGSGEYLKL